MEFGIIGYPLRHSFSPAYFAAKFARESIEATYTAFPMRQIEDLPALLEAHPRLRGLNVTAPYKQAVMSYLYTLSDDAKAIGAVNCIAVKQGRLHGHNTDWTGFRDSLRPLLPDGQHKALVLGQGGASRAVQYALRVLDIPYHTVSRQTGLADLGYDALSPDIVRTYTLLINTTTLGTEGVGLPSLPYDAIGPQQLLYDLVYNPPRTPFLREGAKRGAAIKNGQEMLELQAEASWELWQ